MCVKSVVSHCAYSAMLSGGVEPDDVRMPMPGIPSPIMVIRLTEPVHWMEGVYRDDIHIFYSEFIVCWNSLIVWEPDLPIATIFVCDTDSISYVSRSSILRCHLRMSST